MHAINHSKSLRPMFGTSGSVSSSYNPYSMNTGSAAMQRNADPAQASPQQQGQPAPQKDNSIQSKFYSNSGLIIITVGGVLLSLLIGIADSWKSFKKG